MSGVYIGFDGLEGMRSAFELKGDELDGVDVLLAIYDTPPYEGHAFVLFRKGGELFEVNASHCSCNGLEGQWSPEDVTWEALKHRTEEGSPWWFCYDNKEEARTALADLIIREEASNGNP